MTRVRLFFPFYNCILSPGVEESLVSVARLAVCEIRKIVSFRVVYRTQNVNIPSAREYSGELVPE